MKHDEPDWPFLTIVLLGLWLLLGPQTFGYAGPIRISDHVCGAATVIVGVLTIRQRSRWWARWMTVAIGFWLLFAPLIFASPEAAAYLNNTIVGTLLIALAIVIPRGLNGRQQVEPEVPPGWSYNPSSWLQRTPIIVLAVINFLLARYLAAYQLGHIDEVWDPIFGEGTQNVLTSDISEAFPISDAGLGAVAYMIEALIGCIGNASRWRTAPWVVALFGLLVVPVGVVSLVLIMLQPVAVDDWCLICLITALLMLLMAALAIPEVVALCWFMWRTWREKRPFWRTFFRGGHVEGGTMKEPPVTLNSPLKDIVTEMISGLTAPWSLLICVIAGAWLMAVPEASNLTDLAADSHTIIGAMVITVSVLACAEPTRALRYFNMVLAVVLILAVLLLDGWSLVIQINGIAIAVAVIGLSLPRGRLIQQHGAWQRLIV